MIPATGEQLDRAIDAVMPCMRITDLLWDVNQQTGFLDSFTDLRSGRNHTNSPAVLAAILAGASNLGLERMAQASKDVSHAQLPWASSWYLRPETYSDALAKIVDAHHVLPLARVWGKASDYLLKSGNMADPSLLRHVSPLGWMHINLTGDFVWNSGAAERINI